MSTSGKVAPSRSEGSKSFNDIVGSPTSLTEFGPLTPDEKPQGYGFSISNFFKKAVRGNSPSRKSRTRSGTNSSSSSSGAWQDNPEGAENNLSNPHMISPLYSTTVPEDGPGWLEKSHQDSLDEESKLSSASSMTSLISKLGPAVVSKQDADKHDRNLPNVLIRIKNIIDKRGTTPQQYKDSDFKQYWLPDSVSRECYECEEKFTTFRRRHHCRVCGQIFCSRCCNRMIPGKIIGYTGELRVCTYCCKVVLSYLQSSNLAADVAADLWALGDPLTTPAMQTTNSMMDVTTSTQGSTPPTSTPRGTLKRRPSLGFQEEKYARTRFPSEEYTGMSGQRDSEQMTAERQLLLHDSQQLHSLWQQLLGGPGGLPLGTHRHRLKSFHNCFIGRDLMNWLLTKDKASNRSSAVAIGQALLEAGYLVCISQPEQVFVADYVLYRPSTTGSTTQEAATAQQGSLATQDSTSQEPLWVKQILHTAEGVDTNDKSWGISEDWSPIVDSTSSMTTSSSNYYLDLNLQDSTVSIKKPNTPSSGVQDVINPSASLSSSSLKSSSYATTVSAALSASAQLSQSYQTTDHLGINTTQAINDEVMQALRDHDVQANTAGDTSWQPKDSSTLGNEDRIMRQRLEFMWSSHENALLCQLLDSAGLSSSWAEVILPFVHTITDIIRPDVKNDSDDMDIRQYIQFKKVPGGIRSECEIVNGAVCTKNVADKSMAVRLTDPQILLIATTIDYQRGVDSKLLGLDTLLLQEAEYLKNVVQKISSYRPDIILVEKSIAFLAREALQQEGITLVMNVKPSVMERVARCTQASMVSSIDAQLGRPALGMCHNFYLRSYSVPGRSKQKTLMFFDGCATHLGCTVILRGATNPELKRVKRIMYFMIYAVYNWRLERSFLLEEFTNIPPLPSESFELEDQVFEEPKINNDKEQVDGNKKITEKDTYSNDDIDVNESSLENKEEQKHENISLLISDEIIKQETASKIESDLRSKTASIENINKKTEDQTNCQENQSEEENIKDNIEQLENVFLDIENLANKERDIEAEQCQVTISSVAIQDALKKNEEDMHNSSYCVELSGNDPSIMVTGIDKTKVGQTVSDFSDPLHSYLNSGTSPQESVQSTLPLSEAPYMNTFRKTLDETILSCSPYVKYSVPYLEGEVGRKCNLRRFFNKCLYFSLLLENEKVIRRPRFSEKEEIKDENENVEIRCPHKFTSAKITSDAHELHFRDGLADFRARGGQYRNICHCEKKSDDAPGQRNIQTTENQVLVEGLGSSVEQVFSADSTTTIGNKAQQLVGGSSFSSDAGGLILVSDGRVDSLHAFNHQRLSVLFSSYSQSSHAPPAFCVSPWVLTMDFYGRNDIPLGAFLERYCFSTKYKCPNADCTVAIVDHVRKFVHDGGCVEVLLRKLDTKLDDTNNAQILMWSCCKICRQVTPVVPMSLESWSLSFAKYLELRFHGGTFTRRGTSDCTHSLHHDHFQYFGYNNQVAIFKYAHVSLREIALPPPTMSLKVKPVTQSSIVELIKSVAVLGYSVFYTILERIKSLSEECGPRWDPLISGIEDHHNQQRANFREMIESIQLQLTSPTLEARRMYPPSPGVLQELSTTMLNIADQVILIKRLITKVVTDWNAKVADLLQLSKKEEKLEKTNKASSNSSPLGRQSTSNSLSASLAQISNDVPGAANKQIGDTSSMASSAALTGLSCESLNLTPSQSEHYITENPNRSTDEEVEFGSNKNLNSEEKHQESTGPTDMTAKTQQEESHESYGGGNVMWKCLREELTSILNGLQHLNTPSTPSSSSYGIGNNANVDLTNISTSIPTTLTTTHPSSSTISAANTCTNNTTSVPPTAAVADTAQTPHNAVNRSAPSISSQSSSDQLVMTSWENVSDEGVGLQAVLPQQLSDAYTVLHRRQASDTGEALTGNVMEDYSLKCHERSLSDGGGPTAVGRDTVDKGIPRNASNTVKSIISNFWSSSANLMVESPFSANEHYLLLTELRIPVVVYGDEPSSIIAHALASTEYDKQLQSLRKRIKDSIRDTTSLRSSEKGSNCSLDRFGDESETEDADFSLSLSDSEKSKFTKDPHIELQWNDNHAKFYCKIFFPEHFRQLRRMVFPFGEELYIRSLAHCVPWEARGGKSGSVFCKSHDDRFVLKEMSRYEMNTFLKFGPSYVQYMKNSEREHQPTVLTRIVGVYSIGYKNTTTNKATRLDLLVMENLFYQRNITHKFDLKGSVRNRLVNISGKEESELVLLDENLLRMACSSPLFVRPHSKTVLSRAIAADTVFLSKQLIIDYSLLVGIDDDTNELVIGIIDYIRTFTWDKKLETIIKGSVLGAGTGKLPTVVSPELYRTRFCHAMDRYFLLSPDRWMGMGVGVDHVN